MTYIASFCKRWVERYEPCGIESSGHTCIVTCGHRRPFRLSVHSLSWAGRTTDEVFREVGERLDRWLRCEDDSEAWYAQQVAMLSERAPA